MRTAAVVIGIDAYANKPLTSAVNDAHAFCQTLIDLQLVAPADITLLTAPPTDGGQLPTRDNIANTLYDFYANGDDLDQLFFYFAGHGLLAFSGGEKDRICTALVAQDAVDLRRDGNKLLDLEELRDRLRLAGPQEQFYFVDACREYDYQSRPKVGPLGWEARQKPLGAARAQATLYAVSELGLAEAARKGQGRMTAELIRALRHDVVAVQFDDQRGQWVITMQSVADYVKTTIGESLERDRPYLRKYLEPQLHAPDPRPRPLRVFDQAPEVPLTVHIDPDEAAAGTRVTLSLRGVALPDKSLPPRRSHEPIPLAPQYYLFTVASDVGSPAPARDAIDVRRSSELTIHVSGVPGVVKATAPLVPPPAEIAVPRLEYRSSAGLGPMGAIHARAGEDAVTIELQGLEPPYLQRAAPADLQEPVAPGPYRVRFRLGPEVYNQAEVYVRAGEAVEVVPTIANSALVREALGLGPELPPDVVVSESIGPMQAGLLQTMLTILGIKPFDAWGQLFRQFDGLLPVGDPADFGLQPLSVVVAVDGDGWPASPERMLSQVSCRIMAADAPLAAAPRSLDLALAPLSRPQLRPGNDRWLGGPGFERIALALVPAPANSFALDFETPVFGRFRLFSGSLDHRATVVSLVLHPRDGVSVSQNLLRLPGRDEFYTDERVRHVPYARLLRELTLGQQLYRSGQLYGPGLGVPWSDPLRELLYAKWSDPVLSCMAFFALKRAGERRAASDPAAERWLMDETARNLEHFFGQLPDSRVAHGLAFEADRERDFSGLLDANELPLLAESTRHLARYAEASGRTEARVVEVANRIRTEQIWSLVPLAA